MSAPILVNRMETRDALKLKADLEERFKFSSPEDVDVDEGKGILGLSKIQDKIYRMEREEPVLICKNPPTLAEESCKFQVYGSRLAQFNLDFAQLPTPPGFLIKCRVIRSKKDVIHHTKYSMHLERDGQPQEVLLTAKRSNFPKKEFVIKCPMGDSKQKSFAGLLSYSSAEKCFNLIGKRYPGTSGNGDGNDNKFEDLVSIKSERNQYGLTQLSVVIPKLTSSWKRLQQDSLEYPPEDRESSETDPVVVFKNKVPVWNKDTKTFALNFNFRVKNKSSKNFQLEYHNLDSILLQFGKHEAKDDFILDFSYPFCPLQAFAIALTRFLI